MCSVLTSFHTFCTQDKNEPPKTKKRKSDSDASNEPAHVSPHSSKLHEEPQPTASLRKYDRRRNRSPKGFAENLCEQSREKAAYGKKKHLKPLVKILFLFQQISIEVLQCPPVINQMIFFYMEKRDIVFSADKYFYV